MLLILLHLSLLPTSQIVLSIPLMVLSRPHIIVLSSSIQGVHYLAPPACGVYDEYCWMIVANS